MEKFIDDLILQAFKYDYKIKQITIGYDLFQILSKEAYMKYDYPLNSDPKSEFIYYKGIKLIPDVTNKTFIKIEQE